MGSKHPTEVGSSRDGDVLDETARTKRVQRACETDRARPGPVAYLYRGRRPNERSAITSMMTIHPKAHKSITGLPVETGENGDGSKSRRNVGCIWNDAICQMASLGMTRLMMVTIFSDVSLPISVPSCSVQFPMNAIP